MKLISVFILVVLLILHSSGFIYQEDVRVFESLNYSGKQRSTISETSDLRGDSLGKHFDNKAPFDILSLVKGISTVTTDNDSIKCTTWNISKKELQKIILNCHLISGTEWDLSYDNLICVINAQIKQNGQRFKLELNAGAWMYLHCQDTVLIYGDDNKSDKNYFLSFPEY